MTISFASASDLDDKQVTFAELVPDRAYAYTAEGDPNTGVILGDRGVMVIDTQATPTMARAVIARIQEITARPVTHILLSHYHAVRVLGASAYGAHSVIASRGTHDLIMERGKEDKASEIERFPRLFRDVGSVPVGLTWPNTIFETQLTIDLGNCRVEIIQPGRGHTRGDTIAWLPDHQVLFAGDLVERRSTCYCGDAYLAEWPSTLDKIEALGATSLVPGRGDALRSAAEVAEAISETRQFLTDLLAHVRHFTVEGRSLREVYIEVRAIMAERYGDWAIFEHCMPFNVSRAYDEVSGISDPRIWTAHRDSEMWTELTR